MRKGYRLPRYPWLVRCTEDIRRDCPEAKAVYKALGATYDPTAAYPIETFPVVRVDRHNNPLNPVLLKDFITNIIPYTSTYTSTAILDNNSCVSDLSSNSLDGQSLHNFVSSRPPVIDNPPVGRVVEQLSQSMRAPKPALMLRERVDHVSDRKRSHESSVISSVPARVVRLS